MDGSTPECNVNYMKTIDRKALNEGTMDDGWEWVSSCEDTHTCIAIFIFRSLVCSI